MASILSWKLVIFSLYIIYINFFMFSFSEGNKMGKSMAKIFFSYTLDFYKNSLIRRLKLKICLPTVYGFQVPYFLDHLK